MLFQLTMHQWTWYRVVSVGERWNWTRCN